MNASIASKLIQRSRDYAATHDGEYPDALIVTHSEMEEIRDWLREHLALESTPRRLASLDSRSPYPVMIMGILVAEEGHTA